MTYPRVTPIRAELRIVSPTAAPGRENRPTLQPVSSRGRAVTAGAPASCKIVDFSARRRARYGPSSSSLHALMGSPGVPREELESWLAGQPPSPWE